MYLHDFHYLEEIADEHKAFERIFTMSIQGVDPKKIAYYGRYLAENYIELRDAPPDRLSPDELQDVLKQTAAKLETRARGRKKQTTDRTGTSEQEL